MAHRKTPVRAILVPTEMYTFSKTLHGLACILALAAAASWTAPTLLAQDAATAPPARTASKTRLEIPSSARAFSLGADNHLLLTLNGSPTHIFLMQRIIDVATPLPWIAGGEAEAQLQHSPDGTTYVNFIPLRPGRLEVKVDVFFSDGGDQQASTTVDVVADKPPLKLVDQNGFGGLNSTRRMDLSEHNRRDFLRIRALYAGVKDPLPLDPKEAHYNVVMSTSAPPIAFDQKTMEIRALRLGNALIEIQYLGLTRTTCIQVQENTPTYNRSDCSDLRPAAGQPAAPSSKPSPAYESVLPYTPTDARSGRFLADDRVDVVTPASALHIASNNPITFHLHGPHVTRVECHSLSGDPCTPWQGHWSRENMPLQQVADGTATVNVFPMAFEKQQFTFFILFEDGGVALKKISADVDAGPVKPTAVGPYCTREDPQAYAPVELHAPRDGREVFPSDASILPYACYQGLRLAASLPAPLVDYHIRSEEKQPAISLDASTGKVKALHPGQALVQQTFAGITWNTCVVVGIQGDPDASNCRHLRASFGTPLPQPKIRIRPPNLADEPDPAPRGTPGGIVGMSIGNHPPEPPLVDALTGAKLSPDVRDRFNADQRLQILQKGFIADLGQPARLPVRITGPDVLALSIQQELVRYSAQHGTVPFEESASVEERNASRIGRNPDGTPYLHIVALRPGTAEFRIVMLFADGGIATRIVRLPVRLPPGQTPHLLHSWDNSMHPFGPGALPLRLSAGTTRTLSPLLVFVGQPVVIALNPADVQYSIKRSGHDPVVTLDAKTGMITGLRAGHALISSRYLGADAETCVTVVDDPAEEDTAGCRELHGVTR